MRAKTLLLSLCSLLFAVALPVRATDFTDIWWNPFEPGWGVNLVQSQSFVFATFFIYAPSGAPTWYTAEMTWNGTAFAGPVYATTGTGFAQTWNPGATSAQAVGTATFTPSTAYQGTLSWSVVGVGSATKAIERQTLTTIGLGGSYAGSQVGAYSGCSSSSANGSYVDDYDLTVTHLGTGAVTLRFDYVGGLTCTLSGILDQHGSLYRVPNASYVCSDGVSTTALLFEIKATSLGIEGKLAAPSVGGGCREDAKFSAVLR